MEDIYVERNERGNTELDILSVSIHHGISKNELGSDELGKSVRRSDDKSLYKHVYYGDLVFNMMRAWQGAIGVARNEGMVSPAYISAIPNGSIFPEYMDYCLRRKCIINQINNLSYGVTDFRKRLYWEPFTRVTIMMPSVDEQRKITGVLSRLDHLITLHQKKCFEWKKSGFSSASISWEQRKVGDYYDFKNGLNKGKEFFGEGTPIVNFTDVFHNRGIFPEMLSGKVRLELPEIKNYEVKKGDIFFTRTSETIEEIGYPSVMLGEPKNTVFSGFVLRGRCFLKDEPLDNLFKKYLFFTDAFRTEMLRKSSMTTRALTSGTAIKNMEFLHPSSKEEQHRIGEFLTKLDNLITLHQRKLERLKRLRNSLVDRCFTGEKCTMSKLILYHGSPNRVIVPKFGFGEDRHDYGRGFYLTENLELAKEWAVCRPDETNGWVHKYELEMDGLNILDFQKYDVLSWLAELMKHRDAADSRRYKMLAQKFIEKYGIDTCGYDVITGWRANASYFYIAKEFVRDNIDIEILEELLSLGGLGIQFCIKSERAFAQLSEVEQDIMSVDYSEFNDRYNERDINARNKMRALVNSDANKVTHVFSTLFER